MDFSKPWPGEEVSVSPPEFMGSMPIRQDITVIPADEPKDKVLLDWKIIEYQGTEVFDLSGFFKGGGTIGCDTTLPANGWREDWEIGGVVDEGLEVKFPLPGIWDGKVVIPVAKGPLAVGDFIIVCGFAWHVATVAEVKGDTASAENEGLLFPLSFAKDDRKCWVCSGAINKACLVAMTEAFKTEDGK
jgi:hypothetical protein